MRLYNTLLFVVILTFSCRLTYAQQNMNHFNWVKKFPTEGYRYFANGITCDKNGYLYFSNTFSDSVVVGNNKYYSVGTSDLLLTKYDTSGKLIWASTYGEQYAGISAKTSITTDTANDIIVLAHCADGYSPTQLKAYNAFIAKYSPAGIQKWSIKVKTYKVVPAPYMDVSSSGDIYLVGTYRDSVEINGQVYYSPQQSHQFNFYVSKFDKDGQLQWIKFSEYSGTQLNIKVDNNDDIYITGLYQGDSLEYDGVMLYNKLSVSRTWQATMFVLKINPNGNVIWAKDSDPISKFYDERSSGTALGIDAHNNVYIGGYFRDTISFDNVILTDTTVNSNPLYNATYYLLKLNGITGKLTWMKVIDGSLDELIYNYNDIQINPSGEVFVGLTGRRSYDDANIIQLDTNGSYYWNIKFPPKRYLAIHSMTTDSKGDLFILGQYSPNQDLIIGKDTLTAEPNKINWYFAKLSKTNAQFNIIDDTNDLSDRVQLYPNPNTGTFTILSEESIKNATLYDITGKKVGAITLNNNANKHILDFGNPPTGVYLLKVSAESGTTFKKVIIE